MSLKQIIFITIFVGIAAFVLLFDTFNVGYSMNLAPGYEFDLFTMNTQDNI